MGHLLAPERRRRVSRRAAMQPGRQAGDALDADRLNPVFARLNAFLSGERRPPLIAGVIAAAALVAACTAIIYPLKQVTAVSSLGVVYLFGVVVVSAFWGVWLGVATSLVSAAAFNFFHLPPVGRFTIADSRNWVALAAFFVAALATSWVSELARHRAGEAERRRAEADLTAEIARLVLPRAAVADALGLIGRRLAAVFGLPWATITLDETRGGGRRVAIPLAAGERQLGTLVIPAGMPDGVVARLSERAVPPLSAVLELALEREALMAEAVQTEGLRRSEAVKTAVLRAVSHDLRSPVTAMVAAGAAVRAPRLSEAERDELGRLVVQEGTRLGRLIDDLLDLSKLEAHAAVPRLAECSLEEVIDAALAAQPPDPEFRVRIDPRLSPVRADFGQIERVLANLLENATRYSNGEPVTIRALPVGDRAIIRVIDRGPGIARAEWDRIFEPFYQSRAATNEHAGSGLGLAIAKGFVEANGGRIWVESIPGQGSAFVVELPMTTEAP
jgi:two-component system, OmpR family, sensor histidine kinase KdpD